MSEVGRSIKVLGGVSLAALAAFSGAKLRDWVDVGRAPFAASESLVGNPLLASRDPQGVQVPEGDYFHEMSQLLKREYVEPIADDQKLASGAVRGMVASLNDPNSLFMDKEEFAAFLNARQGKYEGIGAELAFVLMGAENKEAVKGEATEGGTTPGEALMTSARVPRLKVVGIVPGGPADKAGVKVGDVLYSIDGNWVVNTDLIVKLQKASRDFEDKKITQDQLNAVRKEVRDKTERALMPMRARDRLVLGASGSVKVEWERAGAKVTTTIAKAPSEMPKERVESDGTIVLRFGAGSAEFLKQTIAGKAEAKIDLRNNALGDYDTMRNTLEVVAPKGTYGVIASERNIKPLDVVVKAGNPKPPKLTLLVDSSTRGAAEIFALALQSKGLAKLQGSGMGGDRTVKQIVSLPDGSGYTLATGTYQVKPTPAKVAAGGAK